MTASIITDYSITVFLLKVSIIWLTEVCYCSQDTNKNVSKTTCHFIFNFIQQRNDLNEFELCQSIGITKQDITEGSWRILILSSNNN